MYLTKNVKRMAATVGAAGMAMAAAAVLVAPTASAASGALTLCSKGSYDSFILIDGKERAKSPVGQCKTFGGFGGFNGIQHFDIKGGQSRPGGYTLFTVKSGAEFNPSKGGTVTTYGTMNDAWASTPFL
ncbi:MAG TPA: hypothetical protein VGH57_03990 [Amycolatopsis sp.]